MSKINGAAAKNTTKRFARLCKIADFPRQNAQRLRGAYKLNECDKVILPLLVTRPLDRELAPTKKKVLTLLDAFKVKGTKPTDPAADVALRKITRVPSPTHQSSISPSARTNQTTSASSTSRAAG